MSYATIEEAWGGFGKSPSLAGSLAGSPAPSVAGSPAPKPKRTPSAARSPPPATTFEDGQKYVRVVYARYGIKGVLELLGEDISKRLCGKKRRPRGVDEAKKRNNWFNLTPEKMVLLIVVLLGALALMDGFGGSFGTRGSSSSPPPW